MAEEGSSREFSNGLASDLGISGLFFNSRAPVFTIESRLMNREISLLLLCVLSLVFTSCVRTSTVLRVKKDGSGSIVSRYYFSPQMLAMIKQLEGAGGGPDLGLIGEMASPDEDSLRKDSANYGEGVRYTKHEPGKDDEGWEGYVVTYAFDDIRKVRIDQNSVPGKAREFVQSSGEEIEADKGGSLTFALEGDVLTVKTSFAKAGLEGMIDQDQLKQAREMGMTPSQSMKMAAGMAEGMRAGVFLRAEGGIAETTAAHVSGDLVILNDADVAKVLNDPDFGEFIDKAAVDPKLVTVEAVKELFGKLEGMTVETADEITVKLK